MYSMGCAGGVVPTRAVRRPSGPVECQQVVGFDLRSLAPGAAVGPLRGLAFSRGHNTSAGGMSLPWWGWCVGCGLGGRCGGVWVGSRQCWAGLWSPRLVGNNVTTPIRVGQWWGRWLRGSRRVSSVVRLSEAGNIWCVECGVWGGAWSARVGRFDVSAHQAPGVRAEKQDQNMPVVSRPSKHHNTKTPREKFPPRTSCWSLLHGGARVLAWTAAVCCCSKRLLAASSCGGFPHRWCS